jgi:hypothetical protein
MDGTRITWRNFQIDTDDLRIYKRDGKTPVTLSDSSELLYQLTVEILLKLIANNGEPVYAHDIDDWKRMDFIRSLRQRSLWKLEEPWLVKL